MVAALVAAMMMVPSTAWAAQSLDPGCTKINGQNADDPALQPNSGPGTVYCKTEDPPGKSEDAAGDPDPPPTAIVVDETKGNSKNDHPDKLIDDECVSGSPGLCKQATG